MGLSKIFIGDDEFSIIKTINVISQWGVYRNNQSVRNAIDAINIFINESSMVSIMCTYRDKFYGHFDKYYAMSDIRICPEEAIYKVTIDEIERGINLIGELYKVCFGEELINVDDKIEIEDIICMFF